jgi:hypothetical protein
VHSALNVSRLIALAGNRLARGLDLAGFITNRCDAIALK